MSYSRKSRKEVNTPHKDCKEYCYCNIGKEEAITKALKEIEEREKKRNKKYRKNRVDLNENKR